MPKSSMRRSPGRGCLRNSIPQSSNIFLSTPRKVSFEETSCSGSDIDNSEHSTISREPQEQEPTVARPLTRKRSLLARPKSSRSLVDLANQAIEEPSMESALSADEAEPQAKRMCSPRQSPRTTLKAAEDLSKPSPWGQFVDMLVPEDEERGSNSPHLCYMDTLCSNMCCRESSCKARRPSPYGDYKSRARRALPPPTYLHLKQDTFTTPSPSKFRLAPRKDQSNPDQLIGPFSGLNF